MSNDVWIANAYAKINLGLHVLERLPTGYHRIETGFCFLEWYDRFSVQQHDTMKLSFNNADEMDLPTDQNNLIMRAVQKLNTYIGLKHQYKIEVDKRIPVGAGLGGGSSNAALMLRMLNKIEELGLSDDELVDISRDIGADISFFIRGETGIGTGIGADIEPVDIQPDAWIVTVYPKFESSTADAYRLCQPNPEPDFSIRRVLTDYELDEWQYMLVNDLEPPVIQQHHLIGNIRDQMYEFGAEYAAMTGSGSSVYGIFEQNFVAVDAYNQLLDLEYPANITRPKFKPDYGIYRKA